MTTVAASPAGSRLGRHVFGLATFAFGVVTLAWPEYYDRLRLQSIWSADVCRTFATVASVAQLVGGVAMQFQATVRSGAALLCAVYLVIAVLSVPMIFATPRIFDPYADFFEQFALSIGAGIVSGHVAAPVWSSGKLRASGRVLIGLCTASFAVEQATNHYATVRLVPNWIPPDRAFWADATTVAFALAAAALLTNRLPLLAARLLTAMLLAFGMLVRLPSVARAIHDHAIWSETVETFAIAGVAWILADLLGDREFGRGIAKVAEPIPDERA